MNHKAIYALYPQVVSYVEGEGGFDSEGNLVEVDLEAVSVWVDTEAYKTQRAAEYPSIGDQLDALFHAGLFPEDMAAKLQAVKDKYPKV